MSNQISVLEFFEQFPDDDTCLEHLMEVRYGKQFECPKCKKDPIDPITGEEGEGEVGTEIKPGQPG